MRYLLLLILLISSPAFGATLISDHFDEQEDWAPTLPCPTDPNREPPPPWSYVQCDTELYINASAAHGGSGKGFGIDWPNGIDEIALETWAAAGQTELWSGYWYRAVEPFYNVDSEPHKWFRFHSSAGQNVNLNWNSSGHAVVLDSMGGDIIDGDIQFPNDDLWHKVVIYLLHDTSGANGAIRVWIDDVEVNWVNRDGGAVYNNLAIDWGSGTTWEDTVAFGYQSRNGWGGNTSYWDDIIIATTQSEVTDFLGGSTPPPTPEAGESINANIDASFN